MPACVRCVISERFYEYMWVKGLIRVVDFRKYNQVIPCLVIWAYIWNGATFLVRGVGVGGNT